MGRIYSLKDLQTDMLFSSPVYEELKELKNSGNYELHSVETELEIEEDLRIYEELAAQKGQGG